MSYADMAAKGPRQSDAEVSITVFMLRESSKLTGIAEVRETAVELAWQA